MKTKVKKIFVIISIISIIFTLKIVNAATVNVALDSTSELKEGAIIEVTLKVTNIDVGIDSITGFLEYDSNVFEEVTEDNFEGLNRWSFQIYNDDNGKFLYSRSSDINETGEIAKISLKVKDSISVKSTTIKLKDISTSVFNDNQNNYEDLQIPNTEIQIKSKDVDNTNTNVVTNQVSQNVVANQVSQNVVTNQISQNKLVNEGTSSGKLPQTGESYIITISLVAIIIVTIIIYKKYKNLDIK